MKIQLSGNSGQLQMMVKTTMSNFIISTLSFRLDITSTRHKPPNSKSLNMSNEELVLSQQEVQNRIFTFRGVQVMIDRDLAEMYGVENKRLNEQVKRNIERFPNSFRFQLTDTELIKLVANCDRFKTLKHSSTFPYAFTEQGFAHERGSKLLPIAVCKFNTHYFKYKTPFDARQSV